MSKLKVSLSSDVFDGVKTFVCENYFQTLLILFSTVVFCYYTTQDDLFAGFKYLMPWVLLILISSGQSKRVFWCLMVCSAMLCIDVAMNFYSIANHGFMLAYLSLALMISSVAQNPQKTMGFISIWTLTILMGGALIQKLTSQYYMSGNLMGELLARGEMYRSFMSFAFPEFSAATVKNSDSLISDITKAPFEMNVDRYLVVPAGVATFALVLTYLSLAMQFAIEFVLIFRNRLGVWAHYALMLFVVIIYTSRNENTFLSMNCILGYGFTNEETKSVRIGYVLILFFLITSRLLGIRPDLLL